MSLPVTFCRRCKQSHTRLLVCITSLLVRHAAARAASQAAQATRAPAPAPACSPCCSLAAAAGHIELLCLHRLGTPLYSSRVAGQKCQSLMRQPSEHAMPVCNGTKHGITPRNAANHSVPAGVPATRSAHNNAAPTWNEALHQLWRQAVVAAQRQAASLVVVCAPWATGGPVLLQHTHGTAQ